MRLVRSGCDCEGVEMRSRKEYIDEGLKVRNGEVMDVGCWCSRRGN